MGQGFGQPIPHEGIKAFVNLPREAMESLWTSFNLHSEGFGLDSSSLQVIIQGSEYLRDIVGVTASDVEALFNIFDTDVNGLVDALELIICVALLSGMDTVDKINFIFNAYDFESTESLFFDEITLLFRACSQSLKKSCPMQSVFASADISDADFYASLLFQSFQREQGTDKINFVEFRSFCSTHPVISSWLKMMSKIPSSGPSSVQATSGLSDYDIVLYKVWPPYSVFESQLHPVKFSRAVNPIAMATKVTVKDLPDPAAAPLTNTEESPSEIGSELKPFREITAEEDEEIERARAAEAEARRLATLPPPPPLLWFKNADKGRPEDAPTMRKDAAQDTLSLLWVHGLGSASAPRMRRCGFYTANGSILYPASTNVVILKKDEEGVWSQRVLSDHQYPLTCLDLSADGSVMATGDRQVGWDEFGEPTLSHACASIRLWDVLKGTVRGVITLSPAAVGVRCIDFSADGKFLLALLEDAHTTVNIYDTEKLTLLFTQKLSNPFDGASVADRVVDVKFAGTNAIFATAGSTGVNFFIDEGASFMSPEGLLSYEKRSALYHSVGYAASGAVATVLSRFEFPDEIVAGTAVGQLLLWRGRNCIQLLQAHNGAVSSLHYSKATNTLVSGGKDGKVLLYQLTGVQNGASTAVGKQVRQLEVAVIIDVMCLSGITSSYVRSVCLFPDKTKVLVTTFGGELMELSCVSTITSSEGEDAPAEGDAPQSSLGKDINGGPLVRAHFLRDSEPLSKDIDVSSVYQQFLPRGSAVASLCKVQGGFLSAGADGTVRQWAAAEGEAHRCTRITTMDSGIAFIAASSTIVACAFDGSLNLSKRGAVQIASFPDMNYIAELKPCSGDKVYDMKFSPEGNVLAIACGNNKVYFYKEIESVWSLFGEIGTATVPMAFDFTSDGLYIRTCDKDPDDLRSSFTLRFWDVSASFGKEILLAELIRSFQWNTFSCPCAWDSKGLFNGLVELEPEAEVSESEANGLEPVIPQRKPPRTIRRIVPFSGIDRSQALCIVGRRNGIASFHRIPADVYNPDPPPHSQNILSLHSGKISSILFIEEGSRLVTAGADDGVIQVWKVNYDTEEAEPDPEDLPPKAENEDEEVAAEAEEEEEGAAEVLLYDSADEEDLYDGKSLRSHLTPISRTEDKLSAVRDWISGVGVAIVGTGSRQGEHLLDVTTGKALPGCEEANQLPDEELELEWVHGYSGRSTRASVRYNSEGHIVYPASGFGVIFDKVNHKQTPASAHFDEVTCLDVHLAANLAASSHKGAGHIFVCVWDAVNGKLLRRLNCGEVFGASAIAFNPGNPDFLAVALQDASHNVLIFNWRAGQIVTQSIGSHKKTLCLAFSLAGLAPTPATLDELGNPVGGDGDRRPCPRLLAGGVGHYRFIERAVGSVFSNRQGLYGPEAKKPSCLCVAAVPLSAAVESAETEFFMGMSDGTLGAVPRAGGRLASFTPVLQDESGVNSGAVTAIWIVKIKEPTLEEPAEFRIVIGATQGVIKVLDQELQPLNEWNLYGKQNFGLAVLGKLRGFKSICVDRGNRKILYGTAAGEIGEIELADGSDENGGPIVWGHFRDRLCGLAAHPLRQECATVGDDKMLRVWDLQKQRQLLSIALPDISRAVSFSPNGLLIVAGLGGLVDGAGVTRPVQRPQAGQIVVVSYMQNELRIVYIAEECKSDITCLTFSPDGSRLYAGSTDCGVYIFDAVNNFKHVDTLIKHSEPLRSIDIVLDGSRLVTQGQGIEVIVWDTSSYESIEGDISQQLFGQQWFNREGVLAIESLGAFSPFGSPAQVQTVAYADAARLIVSANDQGVLSLRKGPSTALFSPAKQYHAHSPGGVNKVVFTLGDERVLSIGRCDRTLIQWRVRRPNNDGEFPETVNFAPIKQAAPVSTGLHGSKIAPPKQGRYEDSFICNGLDVRRGKVGGPAPSPLGVLLRSVVVNGQDPGCSIPNSGPIPKLKSIYSGAGEVLICSGKTVVSLLDDHLTQRQWCPAPSTILDCQVSQQQRGGDDITAALLTTNIQSISSITVSSCGKYVLVGGAGDNSFELNDQRELVRKGSLNILDAASGSLITQLSNEIEGGVVDVAFSRDGLRCCAIGDDQLHSVHVFVSMNPAKGWADASFHSHTQLTRRLFNLVSFVKRTVSSENQNFDIVCAGEGLPIFLTMAGSNVHATNGSLAEMVPVYPTTALCSLERDQQIAVGDSAGFLWLFEGSVRTKQMFGFHTGPISALSGFSIPGTTVFGAISGSIDCVKVWDLFNMTPLSEFNITDILSKVDRAAYLSTIPTLGDSRQIRSIMAGECSSGYVSSVAADFVFRRLLVTLSTGVVLEFARDSGAVVLVAEGSMSSVVAVASHPTRSDVLVTLGSDRLLRVWTVLPSACLPPRLLANIQVPHTCSALAWVGPQLLAVGMHGGDSEGVSGSILLIEVSLSDLEEAARKVGRSDSDLLHVVSKLNNVGKGPIHQLRCSLPGAGGAIQLAACSEDGAVYLYDFGAGNVITFAGSIIVSPAQRYPIYGVDFSCNGRYVRTFSKTVDAMTPIDVRFFDFQAEELRGDKKAIALEVTRPERMADVLGQSWVSVSSPACAEAEWTMRSGKGGAAVPFSFGSCPPEPSQSRDLLAVGYSDGTVNVFRAPVSHNTSPCAPCMSIHRSDPVFVAFMAGGAYLCTVGSIDGSILLWDVHQQQQQQQQQRSD